MEGLSKGLEMRLPEGHSFVDHSGTERQLVRIRWWRDRPASLRDVAIVGRGQEQMIPDAPVAADLPGGAPIEGSPVFIGHYWMEGDPVPMSPKVACLDWSAAKDGPLVAYRWDGESEIDDRRFVAAG